MVNWRATTWVAVYGAVIATGNLLWIIWRQRRDTGRIRVTIDERSYVLIHIANVGTRPITARRLVGRETGRRPWHRPGRAEQYVSDGLPRTLEPEGSTTLWPLPLRGWDLDGLTALYVEDQAGKHWRVSRKELRHGQQLEAQARRKAPMTTANP